jgi:hypothetical protein
MEAAPLPATSLQMQGYVTQNVFESNDILGTLYDKVRSCTYTAESHATTAGIIYEYLLNGQTFIEANITNPNIVWSLASLFTYYLIGYVRYQSNSFAVGNQNVALIRAPLKIVETWGRLVDTLAIQLNRPVSWFDLLYAANWRIGADRKPEPIFSLSSRATDAPQGALTNAESDFMIALIRISADPTTVGLNMQIAMDRNYISSAAFYHYYVTYFNYLYRISPSIEGRLKVISMRLPIEELNVHFGIESDYDSRLLATALP